MYLYIWIQDGFWYSTPAAGGQVEEWGRRCPGIRRLARHYGAHVKLLDPDTGHFPTYYTCQI